MSVITKPIKTIIAQNLFSKIHQFIKKKMIKYFLWTILIVFITQTIRQVSLFTTATLILIIIIFSVFFGLGVLLMGFSTWFYKLAMNKNLLEVNMSEQGITIVSKYKGRHQEQQKIIPWKSVQQVKNNTDHFCFFFDKQKSTGFQMERTILSETEKRIINKWLADISSHQLV